MRAYPNHVTLFCSWLRRKAMCSPQMQSYRHSCAAVDHLIPGMLLFNVLATSFSLTSVMTPSLVIIVIFHLFM